MHCLQQVQLNFRKDFAPRFRRLDRKSLFKFDEILTDDSSSIKLCVETIFEVSVTKNGGVMTSNDTQIASTTGSMLCLEVGSWAAG